MNGPWTDGFVEVDGRRLHYTRSGGEKPPVVLAHGGLDDGLCWTRVAKVLEGTYDVVMPDCRGHGRSDHGGGDYSSHARAADLAGVIRALHLDRPVVGGHSMGADASLHLAADHPELISAVFLEDPPILLPGQSLFGGKMAERFAEPGRLLKRMTKLVRRLPMPLAKTLARQLMPGAGDDEVLPWIASKRRVSDDFLDSVTLDMGLFADSLDAIKRISVPALLLRGDREAGGIVGEEAAAKAVEQLPALQVAHLPGASHDIRRSRFEAYVGALLPFIAANR